jgi:hypothetical protein
MALLIGTLRIKHSLSRQHLTSATYFSQQSATLERSAVASDEDQARHRSYVIGAVISAVAALEASINELYMEAQDQNRNPLPSLTPQAMALLSEFWGELERKPILHKYQIALLVAGVQQFDKGQPPYRDADNLIKLRDSLIHYKPHWDDEPGQHRNLQERLGTKFPLNALAASGSVWFPHQCLGAGCAQWAIETSRAFMEQFCVRLNIPDRF